MRIAQFLSAILLLTMITFSVPENVLAAPLSTAQETSFGQTTGLRPLKVHMNSRTLWSDGGYSPAEMVNAARKAGYDAVFFADNTLDFEGTPHLADPSFESVGPSGNFTYWKTETRGTLNSLAYAGPFTVPPLFPGASGTQIDLHNYALNYVRSGNRSLALRIQSSSTNFTTDGYATATPIFPSDSSERNNHPLLSSDITFSAYVNIQDLMTHCESRLKNATANCGPDHGWFYFRFTLVSAATRGPSSGERLTITLVWSARYVDASLIAIRSGLNETKSKVIYFNHPPYRQWSLLTANVTDLALHLWNHTIVDEWRLGSFEIGARSRENALVEVYVDDVSLSASESWNPLAYLSEVVQPRLSNESFKTYFGYSTCIQTQPQMYVYNTSYFDPSQEYNLSDVNVWRTVSDKVALNSGVIGLGPVDPAWVDYVSSTQAFGVGLIDATSFSGIDLGRNLFQNGERVAFFAAREAVRPSDYNSTSTWSVRVYADSNSENDILKAILSRRAYLAVSNYTGLFTFSPLGFPTGNRPIYVPSGLNVSLPISFNATNQNGMVRVYQDYRLDTRIPYAGNTTINFSAFMLTNRSSFIVTVTGANDTSLMLVSDPVEFHQASIIPAGALFLDNDQWTLKSSQWSAQGTQQSFQLGIQGPAGTNTTLYLYSPNFAPNAKDPTQLLRWMSIDGKRLNAGSMYEASTSTFIIHVKSTGQPVQIEFNFDIPKDVYLTYIFTSVIALYLVLLVPFAIAVPAFRIWRRRSAKH